MKACVIDEAGGIDRRVLRRVCRAFMARLHARFHELVRARRAAGEDVRRICDTCAFRRNFLKATGLETTALAMQRALERGNGFWCHHGLPKAADGTYELAGVLEKQQREGFDALCAGYCVVREDPKARRAFVAAALEHEGELADAD